jgi:hypothetical protein
MPPREVRLPPQGRAAPEATDLNHAIFSPPLVDSLPESFDAFAMWPFLPPNLLKSASRLPYDFLSA